MRELVADARREQRRRARRDQLAIARRGRADHAVRENDRAVATLVVARAQLAVLLDDQRLGLGARQARDIEHGLVALAACARAFVADHLVPIGAARRCDADIVEHRQPRACAGLVEHARRRVELFGLRRELGVERCVARGQRIEIVAIAHL